MTPATGSLAPFGQADTFVLNQVRQTFKDGIKTKNGKRNVEIVVRDSQSSSARAGQVASDLILNHGVSLMLVSSTPETTNPCVTWTSRTRSRGSALSDGPPDGDRVSERRQACSRP